MRWIRTKIKSLLNENRKYHRRNFLLNKEIKAQNQEILWSQIYHDSIRGKNYLENLSLNVGRWAGNYTFFYVLNRILHDSNPKRILELGLGESSKMVSAYMNSQSAEFKHLIIEQDIDWKNYFLARSELSKQTEIQICELEKKEVHGYKVNAYTSFQKKVTQKFDLYIIDGPYGSERFSRYDIISLVEEFQVNDNFILLFDDFDRRGEQDTVKEAMKILSNKNILIYQGTYAGLKSVHVISTKKNKFLTSL